MSHRSVQFLTRNLLRSSLIDILRRGIRTFTPPALLLGAIPALAASPPDQSVAPTPNAPRPASSSSANPGTPALTSDTRPPRANPQPQEPERTQSAPAPISVPELTQPTSEPALSQLSPEPAPEPALAQLSPEPAPEPALAPDTSEAIPAPSDESEPVAQPAQPPPDPPLQIIPSGSLFTRFELRRRYDDLGVSAGRFTEGDAVAARMRLGLNTSPWDLGAAGTVHTRFAIQATGFWGLMPQQLADANAGLHEAYLSWEATPWFSLTVGRMELDYGDALVIGNVDWHENGRSFDGARSRFRFSPGWLDLFWTQLTEGRGGTDSRFGAGDSYFGGLYASFTLDPALTLDPYALFRVVPAWRQPEEADEPTTVLATVGLRATGRVAAFDYRLEGGAQAGRQRPGPQAASQPARAYQIDAELGINLLANRLRVGLEGFIASGDDPETARYEGWDQLYPTAHKWLGLMDVTGPRSNVGGGVLHLKASPVQPVRLMAQAHVFARPAVADGVDHYLGSELDLGAAYVIGPGFVARALYGVYLPNEDGPLGESRAAHYVETELRFDF